jgi:hypothetical protein
MLPLTELRQQIYDGLLPWGNGTGSDPSLPPQLSRIKQQMGMVAFDLRAAEQEVRLIDFEMNSFTCSIGQEVGELVAALEAQLADLSQASSKLDQLEQALAAAAQPQQYQLFVSIRDTEQAADTARARMLLLQQKLNSVLHLQSVAQASFAKYRHSLGSTAAIARGAASALVDELAADGVDQECDSDPGDDECSDDGAEGGEPDAAAAAAAATEDGIPEAAAGRVSDAAAAAGDNNAAAAAAAAANAAAVRIAPRSNPQAAARNPAAAASGGASSASSGRQQPATPLIPLHAVKRFVPQMGPDAVVTGGLPQNAWGNQVGTSGFTAGLLSLVLSDVVLQVDCGDLHLCSRVAAWQQCAWHAQ